MHVTFLDILGLPSRNAKMALVVPVAFLKEKKKETEREREKERKWEIERDRAETQTPYAPPSPSKSLAVTSTRRLVRSEKLVRLTIVLSTFHVCYNQRSRAQVR